MTKEEVISRLIEAKKGYKVYLTDEVIDIAIKAVAQEPCESCISKEAVDILVDELARAISDERCCISRGRSTATIMQDILHLPTVTPQSKYEDIVKAKKYDKKVCTPQPKIGHWIKTPHGFKCSKCFIVHSHTSIFCPSCGARMVEEHESDEVQPKQTDDSCLDFDFDKVKEILKKDSFDNLIVVHTCEEKQAQTRDEKIIDAIEFAIKVTDTQDDYSMGMRNGMRYVKSLIDGKEPQYELRRTDEEIKLGIDLGDEVVGDYGAKGVVVGIDTSKDEVWLSLLMRNHKVPQLVKASMYKTKTGRHFPQIIEVLEQIKGESGEK